ncbi:aldehyde dehydrogenase family protein [Nonomuraea sp. NPDC026600]|uniref:aldehyde dehydrogenase family protein n=1 Tax=Nonomuraea sp. NPDC026600 TaxID=3155363 RepID=UPI0033C0BD8C
MIVRDTIYIDGRWVASEGTGSIEVLNPATGEVLGTVPAGTAADVDRAARAARRAFPGWAATPVGDRVNRLRAVATGLREREKEIVDRVISEVGTPRAQAGIMQFGIVVQTFEDAADRAEELFEVEQLGNSLIRREPIGVVGAIAPWNYPLYQIALKIAPALAAGCTVVIKPSEVAGLTPYLLAEILDQAGFPPGVVNLVSGTGPEVGEAIAAHPEIDMVSFTGSDRAGRRVAEVAAATVKKVALELGGKSPMVVLDDGDLEAAVSYGVTSCYANAGQMCAALTRMIVPRSRLAEVEQLVVRVAASYVPGDPDAAETKLGPVISPVQRDRVLGLIDAGIREGAKLLLGGPATPTGRDRGFYVPATVFSEVKPHALIAQEEIFGPVLAIIPVDDEDEAVAVANGTRYGLNAAVWSADVARAERVAAQLNASTVYINGGKFNPSAPFGGTKGSGYGRERGRFGLEEYLRTKSYQY